MTFRSGLFAVALMTGLAGAAFAASPEPIQQNNSNAVWFENWNGLSNAKMVVTLPTGAIETVMAESGTPVFRLTGDPIVDGVYRYEISAASDEMTQILQPVDNGRGENAKTERNKPFYMTGQFVVSRNVIITPEDIQE